MERCAGHTLVELLVAVAVVAAVMAAASSIFGSAARVVEIGEAAASVLAETAAIERQVRADLSRVCPQGFLAIRCVAVPNDVRGDGTLLHPALPRGAVIRADQLVFFTQGPAAIQTFRTGAGVNRKGCGSASRVYYGHAFQVRDGPPAESADEDGDGDVDVAWAIDPAVGLVPWAAGTAELVRTRYQKNAGDPPGDYRVEGSAGAVDATQPPAARWLLCRQQVTLADDGGSPAVFLFSLQEGGFRSTASIFDAAIRNGRVDAAASQLGELRSAMLSGGDGHADSWSAQRERLAQAVFYPRAERMPPGPHRVDAALASSVLSSGCSSFMVDWTYRDGIGEAGPYAGLRIDRSAPQPWFGQDPCGDPSVGRGVRPLSEYLKERGAPFPETFDPALIERYDPPATVAGEAIRSAGASVYEALFGFNADMPLDPATGAPWPADGAATAVYTPWPSAIRITMVLHDPRGRPEAGRTVQLVVELPAAR